MTETWCSKCDNVCNSTRTLEPWKWRCMMVPAPSGYGWVDPTYSPTAPYEQCSRINKDGNCEWYTPRREGKIGDGDE